MIRYSRDWHQAADTLLWQGDHDELTPRDLAWRTVVMLCALVDAVDRHRPPHDDGPDDLYDREYHRSVLSVLGHGTGLWDCYPDPEGIGRAWHNAVCADPEVLAAGWYSGASTYVGDDGQIYIG